MISKHILELINAEIDGELRREDQSELDAALESSAEARAAKSELQKLSNLLDGLPPQQPPKGLGGRIQKGIELPVQKSSFSLGSWFPSFQPVTAGVAFAAGLLLTAGFYELSPERAVPGDSASMVGTMIAGEGKDAGVLKNDMRLQGDGFSGMISLRENSGIYVLNFDLESEMSTEVNVGLDSTGFAFGGFAEIHSNENRVLESVMMSGGALRVVNQGHQQFAVFLREDGAGTRARPESIAIDFSSADRL
jgi:hypothetical protein